MKNNKATNDDSDNPEQLIRTLKRLVAYLFQNWPAVVLLCALVMISSLLATYPVIIIRKIVDVAAHTIEGGFAKILALSLWLLGLKVVSILCQFGFVFLSAYIEERLGHRMRVNGYHHVQSLSLGFYESGNTGELMSKLIGDAEVTIRGFLSPMTSISRSGVSFIMVVGFMFAMNWKLTLFSIPATFIAGLLTVLFGPLIRRGQHRLRATTGRLWSLLAESLRGMRDIQANNQQAAIEAKIEGVSEKVQSNAMAVARTNAFAGLVDETMFVVTIAIVMILGGYWTFHGQMTPGTLAAFMMYAHMLVSPIADIALTWRDMQKVMVSAERVFKILDEIPVIANVANATEMRDCEGTIEFRNVSYRYDEAKMDVLKKVNLQIEAGQCVALVGPSGEGKTTIVKMLLRFYDPSCGEMLINDMNIRNVTLESLRANIGVLFQDPFLFDGTLASNIRFARGNASAAEVENAAGQAGLNQLLQRLPNGLHTVIGENGVRLSQGERQRVGLARVILKRPAISILDEPTASLDALTTSEIMSKLRDVMNNETILIISHRLGCVMDADLIIVLAGGRIVEQGTHSELYTRKGLYRTMHDAQFGRV